MAVLVDIVFYLIDKDGDVRMQRLGGETLL
jgi:hypothetical protein